MTAGTPSVPLVDGLAPAGVEMKGVPALPPCRVKVNYNVDPKVVTVIRRKEVAKVSLEQKQYRDPEGLYSSQAPYWAQLVAAR